jgi:poly-gamma-glutamate synthesis protein (capsule biosynthesis protein)
VRAVKRQGDVAVASVHWGENWGYAISPARMQFARRLIETAGIDVLHGHSSHHPQAIEVFRGKLILYGCGDFINDYEGIAGHEEFRSDLGLMYFPTVDAESGKLLRLELAPMRRKRLQVRHASPDEARWLRELLDREGRRFGTSARLEADRRIALEWRESPDPRIPNV